jgi:hypothetical protein
MRADETMRAHSMLAEGRHGMARYCTTEHQSLHSGFGQHGTLYVSVSLCLSVSVCLSVYLSVCLRSVHSRQPCEGPPGFLRSDRCAVRCFTPAPLAIPDRLREPERERVSGVTEIIDRLHVRPETKPQLDPRSPDDRAGTAQDAGAPAEGLRRPCAGLPRVPGLRGTERRL